MTNAKPPPCGDPAQKEKCADPIGLLLDLGLREEGKTCDHECIRKMSRRPTPTVALYAASFDPITFGHVAIILEALEIFDRLEILIDTKPNKAYTFTSDERAEIVRKTLQMLKISASVKQFYNESYARSAPNYTYRGTSYIEVAPRPALIRSLRSTSSAEQEVILADLNRLGATNLTPVLIPMPKKHELFTSSFVKETVLTRPDWIDHLHHFVPYPSIEAFAIAYLRKQWDELTNRNIIPPIGRSKAKEAFGELMDAYTMFPRFHHGVEHLVRGLDDIHEFYERDSSLMVSKAIKDEVLFAWFYHNVVYHRYEDDSEEASAKVAEEDLTKCHYGEYDKKGKESIERIKNAILATKDNGSIFQQPQTPVQNPAGSIVADIDLNILGKPPETYDRYTEQVRWEHSRLSDTEFATARTKLLQGFLDRRRIYHTSHFAQKYEDQARRNITRELTTLLPKT